MVLQKQNKTEASFHDTVRSSSETSKKQPAFLYIKLSAFLPPSSCLHSIYQQDAKTDWHALNEEMFYLLRNQPALARREGNGLTFLPLFLLAKNKRCH